MKKKTFVLGLAITALATVQTQAASLTGNVEGYAEGVYNQYAAGTDGKVLFEVETLERGALVDLAGIPFGDLIEAPAHRVEASPFGLEIRKARFTTPSSRNYATEDLQYSVEGFEEIGYPVEMGTYRKLQVGVAIGSEIQVHEALEFSWPKLGHSTILDPAVVFLESLVNNRARLAAEGWGPKVVSQEAAAGSRASCRTASDTRYIARGLIWHDYEIEYKALFGNVLVRKQLGEQKSGVYCEAATGCTARPWGMSTNSSCQSFLTWSCQCDGSLSGFGTNSDQRTGKMVAETRCSHRNFSSAKANGSISDAGSLNVEVAWQIEGSTDQNGGSYLESCVLTQ